MEQVGAVAATLVEVLVKVGCHCILILSPTLFVFDECPRGVSKKGDNFVRLQV